VAKFAIPSVIDVGPLTIAVEFDDVISPEEFGEFRYDTATIKIDGKLRGKQQALEIFFHEVIEAVNMVHELNLPHAKIQILGATLAQVIKSAK
jgi:hypothetical protein